MKLCAFIQTEDKLDCAYFTEHGNMRNALFIHTTLDKDGRLFEEHTTLMVRFPTGERGKEMGNHVYTDLIKEGYKRVQLKEYEVQNALTLVRSWLPECQVLK